MGKSSNVLLPWSLLFLSFPLQVVLVISFHISQELVSRNRRRNPIHTVIIRNHFSLVTFKIILTVKKNIKRRYLNLEKKNKYLNTYLLTKPVREDIKHGTHIQAACDFNNLVPNNEDPAKIEEDRTNEEYRQF